MRFGSCERFAIEINPVLPNWGTHVSPDDHGPWAEWILWVGGKALTLHQMPGEDRLRNGVYLPLLPLARWFQSAWWAIGWEQRAPGFPTDVQLPADYRNWGEVIVATGDDDAADRRDGWWERHFLEAADTGAWLPRVAFVRIETQLWVSWQPHRPAGIAAPEFVLAEGTFAVRWEEAQQAVEEFCRYVANITSTFAQLDPGLINGPPPAKDTLAWLTGAPDTMLPEIVQRLLKTPPDHLQLDDIEASVGVQAARDVAWDQCALGLLEALQQETSRPSHRDGKLAHSRDAVILAERWRFPETEGVQVARALRESLGLGSARLPDVGPWFEATFGIETEHRHAPGTENQMLAGSREDAGAVILTLEGDRRKKDWEKRAEAVRGLGHLLMDYPTSKGVRGAAHSPAAEGPRTRRAGAFMAEMLLPTAALKERFKGQADLAAKGDAFRQLMNDYGVGATLAAWQLYNQRFLSSKGLVQELIDEYASD